MRFESILQCVECKKNLNKIKDGYVCVNKHKFLGGIPDFIVDKKGLKDEFNAQENAVGNYEGIQTNKAVTMSWRNWKKKLIVDKKGLVLDNGCGTGKLISVIPEGNIIVGSDVSLDMLKEAKKRLKYLVRAQAEKLPFKDEIFDVVYTDSVLHHLKNPEEGIKEIFRVLKDDGIAVVSETHAALINRKLRRNAYKDTKRFGPWHKNFERKELLSIVKKYFEVYSMENVSYLGYMYEGTNRMKKCDKYIMAGFLGIDKIISKIPFVKNQSWHIILKMRKNE
ncbi:MAG TPA: class I SAM-dependent methyltransferase [Candidatus Nanoarchaeia archaeon]|nr:class I SAM-dependent methyltransferase [Candidatus Nanoarchaeia archaeon]